MVSAGVAPSGYKNNSSTSIGAEKLQDQMNELKIRDDKEVEATIINGKGTETGHIIVTTTGGKNGQPKQTVSYMAERIVGQDSFGIVFQAKCLETGETVAIKKVLQDKRYKNRELQTMRLLDHPNVVALKHCFFSTTEKDELYLNLVLEVLEYVPETVHRVVKHHNKMNQRMPLIYVKLYMYQKIACCWRSENDVNMLLQIKNDVNKVASRLDMPFEIYPRYTQTEWRCIFGKISDVPEATSYADRLTHIGSMPRMGHDFSI